MSAVHVAAEQLARIAGPQTIVGRDVVDETAPGQGPAQRIEVAQIADDRLHLQIGEIVGAALRPDQGTDVVALLGQEPGDVTADEAGAAGDEDGGKGGRMRDEG